MEVVYKKIQYLKSFPRKGLLFARHYHLKAEGYTYADWAGLSLIKDLLQNTALLWEKI
jgi:hypothetical protein